GGHLLRAQPASTLLQCIALAVSVLSRKHVVWYIGWQPSGISRRQIQPSLIPAVKKLNPIWWFGHADEQQTADWYHPEWARRARFVWRPNFDVISGRGLRPRNVSST